MTYDQAVAWLEEILDRPLMLGFKINVRAVLAVLEREHEEAERLRNSILNDMAAVLCDPDGNVCIRGSDGDRKVLQDAIDRARKGVTYETR